MFIPQIDQLEIKAQKHQLIFFYQLFTFLIDVLLISAPSYPVTETFFTYGSSVTHWLTKRLDKRTGQICCRNMHSRTQKTVERIWRYGMHRFGLEKTSCRLHTKLLPISLRAASTGKESAPCVHLFLWNPANNNKPNREQWWGWCRPNTNGQQPLSSQTIDHACQSWWKLESNNIQRATGSPSLPGNKLHWTQLDFLLSSHV